MMLHLTVLTSAPARFVLERYSVAALITFVTSHFGLKFCDAYIGRHPEPRQAIETTAIFKIVSSPAAVPLALLAI